MNTLLKLIFKKPKIMVFIFLILFIGALILIPQIKINKNNADYLPNNSEAKQGLVILEQEFPNSTKNNNAKILIKNKTVDEVIQLKQQIQQIDGIQKVTWLDDYVDLSKVPIEQIPDTEKQNFIKNGDELLTVVFTHSMSDKTTQNAIKSIDDLLQNQGGVGFTNNTDVEVGYLATIIGIIIIVLIILLFTDSYFASIFVIITLGLAIILNLGTNIIFGKISQISFMAVSIIQLAVSIDYSLIYLKNLKIARKDNDNINEAVIKATKMSFKTMIASATTTVAGFLALGFMSYQVGSELGIILAKGVVLSFIVVLIFLPILIKLGYKLVDKTTHRQLLPSFNKISKMINGKVSVIILIILIILGGLGFYGQLHNSYTYADTHVKQTTIDKEITNEFGANNHFVLLVPKGDKTKELSLVQNISQLDNIQSVSDIYTLVGANTPDEYIPQPIKTQFWSKNYSLISITVNVPLEGKTTFNAVEEIRKLAHQEYNQSYLTGQSPVTYDIKTSINHDYLTVMLISIIAITLIIFITFKSITIPLILMILIESAIWMNMSVPYYQGITISFLGYILISSIQLGATIDYAIIITEHYEEERQNYLPVEAARRAFSLSSKSILVSMSALAISGFILSILMKMDVIKQLGILIGRGSLISGFISLLVLPQLLILFDKAISKTTLKRKSK